MANSDIKQHVSIEEKNRWNKVIVDFGNHLGSGGTNNHRLADGTIQGFSTNDYSTGEKNKLAGIQNGALNNPHPASHPHTMITGLHQISWTGNYTHLNNIPSTFIAGGGNSDTVGGIRFTVGPNAPGGAREKQDVWFNTTNLITYVFTGGSWMPSRAVYS